MTPLPFSYEETHRCPKCCAKMRISDWRADWVDGCLCGEGSTTYPEHLEIRCLGCGYRMPMNTAEQQKLLDEES